MLKEIHIRNWALVEDVSLSLESGFVSFTGETGAGKSLLVDAISLLIGAKAETDKVRSGSKSAEIEGVFDLSKNSALIETLNDAGFEVNAEDGHKLIVRREISSTDASRNRIWIQGRAATRSQLSQYLSPWVEVSGQHEFLKLNNENYLLKIIDNFGGLTEELAEYNEAFELYNHFKKELEEIEKSEMTRSARIDFLKFQIEELEKAGIESKNSSSEADLEKIKARLGNIEKLKNICTRLRNWVQGAESSETNSATWGLVELSQKIVRELRVHQNLGDDFHRALEISESLVTQIDLLESEIAKIENSLEVNPSELENAAQKLSLIQRLKRKHNCEYDRLVKMQADWTAELGALENMDSRKAHLVAEFSALQKNILLRSEKLHKRRSESAREMTQRWSKDIRELGLEKSQISVETIKLEGFGPRGTTRIQIQFSANPGEIPKNLAKVASGGELSRILLALKNLVAGRSEIGVYLFDEIDSGIGGNAALKVAKRLRKLSQANQVLVVTHMASIAAFSHQQFLISKNTQKGRTRTFVSPLDHVGRESEIARMLGGENIDAAQNFARELLASGPRLDSAGPS